MTVDVLAVGAHPDDVEVGIGALVHKLARSGKRVAILDLTRGEMGSRGTPEERREEALNAARVLGASPRENAGLPDGSVANTPEQRLALIPILRALRPAVLLAPMQNDRHPDHHAAHFLVRDANYLAGLMRIDTGQEPYRIPRMYYYPVYIENRIPDLIVDVSEDFEAKLEALAAFKSQFYNPEYDGPPTYVASEAFWQSFRTRAAYLGGRIGAAYGEPLYIEGPVGVAFPPGLEVSV